MISILVPTRGRVRMFKEMLHSVERTTQYDNIEIVAYVDDDDPDRFEYQKLFRGEGNDVVIVGPRIILTDCWNKCFAACRGDIVMQGNDDIIFRTRGWDKDVADMFAASQDKIWLLHGNDMNPNRSYREFGTHCLVHRRWVETLGYFIAPYFSSDYGDTWLNEIADRLNRRAPLDFVCEHMHFSFGKSELDENAAERLARHKADNPEKTWEEKQPERDAAVAKLQAIIDAEAVR